MASPQANGKSNASIELEVRRNGDHARHRRAAQIENSPIIEGLCKKTDLHALPDWHSALSEKRKRDVVIWSVIVVLAVAALVWQLYETLNDFIEEPILSEYNLRAEGSMTLPDVYICPPMKLHQRNLAQLRSPYLALLKDRQSDYRRYMTFMYYHKTIGNTSLMDEKWLEDNALGLLDIGKDDFGGLLGSLSTAFDRDASISDAQGFYISSGPTGGTVAMSDEQPAPPMLELNIDKFRAALPTPCGRKACATRPPPFRVWTPADAQEFYMAAGFGQSQFIRECQIGAPDDGRGLRDCTRLVTEVFDPEYGKCFVLELNKYKVRQTVAGRGVSIVLDLNYEHSNPKMHQLRPFGGGPRDDANCKMGRNTHPTVIEYSADSCTPSLPKGAKCMLEEHPEWRQWDLEQCALNGSDDRPTMDGALVRISAPHDPAHKAAIYAQTGMRTSVLLSLTKMQMLDQKSWLFYPAKLCVTDDEQETMMHMLSLRYSVGTCRLQCAMDDVYKRCDCIRPIATDFLKPHYAHKAYCTKQQMEQCAINHERLLKVRDKIHECAEKCLPPCDYNNFRTSVSMAKLVVEKLPNYYARPSKEAKTTKKSAAESPPLPAEKLSKTLAELGFTAGELLPKSRDVVCAFQPLPESEPTPPLLTVPVEPDYKGPRGDNATWTADVQEYEDEDDPAGGLKPSPGIPPPARRHRRDQTVPPDYDAAANGTVARGEDEHDYDTAEQAMPPPWPMPRPMPGPPPALPPLPIPIPCGDIDMDAAHNVTCWIKYFDHHRYPNVGCPYDKVQEFKPDMEMTLSELGITTQQQYDDQFEWWKRVGDRDSEKPENDATSYRNRDDIIVLEIAYSEMQYVDIQQEHSMTLSTFIGNVGGQFGLWLGASIISMIKLVLLCCDRKSNGQAGNVEREL